MRMKPLLVLLTTILVCVPAAAGAIRLTETWRQSFTVGASPVLKLENVNGNIWIGVGAENVIEARAEIRVKATSKSSARDLIDGVKFETALDGSSVSVRTVLPRVYINDFPVTLGGEPQAIRVRYFVTVPRGSSLVVRTVNGDIEIEAPEGALGAVDAHAEHGQVVTR
jgi:hypothetical protein